MSHYTYRHSNHRPFCLVVVEKISDNVASMYFYNRQEAGKKIADSLIETYRGEDTIVLALSPGAVVVGYEIAMVIGCEVKLLMTEAIAMPGVASSSVIGLIDQEGHFTRNSMMPTGLLMEFEIEMRSYIESEKLQKLSRLHRAIDEEGQDIDPAMFSLKNVLVVSDGFKNGMSFDAAANYLKTVATKKLVGVAPNSSVAAIDLLHISADALAVLDVLPHYLDTNHYFEDNTLPDPNELMRQAAQRARE